MNGNPDAATAAALCRVLEDFAFMFGEKAHPGELPPLRESGYRAGIGFRGPFAGALTLAAPRAAAAEIAANVLGLDVDDPVAGLRGEDALKELLDIACGQFLTALAGEDATFDLSVPESGPLDADAWDALRRAPGVQALRADGHAFLLQLTLQTES